MGELGGSAKQRWMGGGMEDQVRNRANGEADPAERMEGEEHDWGRTS